MRFERHIALLLLLLLIWNVAGLLSLLNVPARNRRFNMPARRSIWRSRRYCLPACSPTIRMPRIVTVRKAYVLTATFVALAGIAGYFRAFPGRP